MTNYTSFVRLKGATRGG